MGKRLEVTPKIAAALKAHTEDAVQPSDVAIFETISLNTLPIKQRGLFNGGRVTANTLNQMAAYLNGGGHVPLQTMHLQHSELPVGKTFYGEVFQDENGTDNLRTLFYMSVASEPDLIDKVEKDIINEVSVGFQSKHINCSECGWDYLGDDSTFSNIYNGMCANDHEVGVDGVHVILNGLDRFYEQSLVPLGAANGARIQSRAKALIGAEKYATLMASGHNPEITILHAVKSMKEASNMDLKDAIAQLATVSGKEQFATMQLTAANAELTTVKASLTETTTKLSAVEAELATLKSTPVPTAVEVTAAKAEAEAAKAALMTEATRLTVILGLTAPAATATIAELTASINTNRAAAHDKFQAGGVEKPKTDAGAIPAASFKGA